MAQPWLRRRTLALSVAGVALVGVTVWAALRPSGPANGAPPHRTTDSVAQVPSAPPSVATSPADTIRPHQPAVARARLSLSTRPPGMLFLDGKPIRSTPVIGLEIAPGRHRVQVKRDGFAPFDTVLTATPGQEIKWTRKTLTPIGS